MEGCRVNFYPFHIGDYVSKTRHLTWDEDMAYRRLLDLYYTTEKPLPLNKAAVYRFTMAQTPEQRAAIDTVLVEFFDETPEGYRNKRCDEQLSVQIDKRAKASQSANKRWGNASAMPAQCEANATNTNTNTNTKEESSEPSAPEENTAACVRIGQKITDLMGVTNDPRWVGNWSTVSVWLAQGYDEDLDILPTVVATVERFKKTGRKMPGSLKYFSNAIAENHKARQETGTSPVQPSQELMTVKKGTPGHRAWMAHYRKLGKRMAWFEAQDFLTVPSEYPQEQAA
jgi:uncharacterized protein YdaU (DUF1376 family)